MDDTFDHIVIGGGSSGCVVAARLAAEGAGRVLLLEGGHGHHHRLLDMPPGIFKMINGSKFMRYHTTMPQPHLDGRAHEIPQGNVLGGGSSVNAQVYIRGRPTDFDEWDTMLRGNNDGARWDYDTVLPHFRAMESNDRLNNTYHGTDGPMLVSDPGHVNEIFRWFVQAVQAMGEPFNADFNGSAQRGVGFFQFMNRHGRRSSAAYAYIEPQAGNKNLTVRLHARVSRILMDKDRAVGVVYRAGAKEHTVRASHTVIVAAGALVTPQVLMLSGIGPAEHLKAHGIAAQIDLQGVGDNLIDHPEVPMTAMANGPYGYFRQGKGWRMLKNGLQFKLFGSGPILSSGVEAGAFVNPLDRDAPPSMQAFCVPMVYFDRDSAGLVENDYGMSITTVVVKPVSRGSVRLTSADPAAMPAVSPNLLKAEADMRTMVAGQRFMFEAFRTPPLADRLKRIAVPDPAHLSDAALAAHCKRFVKTNYHPAGTAKMGADGDPLAVLDARLRVRGTQNLMVTDMSAVPNIVAGNTNATAMMLGNRCADFILANA